MYLDWRILQCNPLRSNTRWLGDASADSYPPAVEAAKWYRSMMDDVTVAMGRPPGLDTAPGQSQQRQSGALSLVDK